MATDAITADKVAVNITKPKVGSAWEKPHWSKLRVNEAT
jgi:hypothetical protein